METELKASPRDLGALSFAESVAFSCALPFWGSIMQFWKPRDLLGLGCFLWGIFTLAAACSSNYMVHVALRLLIGASLAVVNPIGQAMICDLVPEQDRGSAFGLLQSVSTILSILTTFFTTSMARNVYYGMHGWRLAYSAVAFVSFCAGMLVMTEVPAKLSASTPKERSWTEEQARVVKLVCKKPSFLLMVLQGVTGGIPWNAFAFLPFYFQLSGYTDAQAAQILLYGGVGGMFGGLLGGKLGDRAHRWWPYCGRCLVAQLSVVLGIMCFLGVMGTPYSPASFWIVIGFFFMFNLTACWSPAAALRPICGDVVRDSRDRAQILALWIAFEGTVSAFCGAPLVGFLSEAFGYSLTAGQMPMDSASLSGERNSQAVRSALLGVSVVPWVLCTLAWLPLYCTYPKDAGH
ncbi:unnamed protein product [Effrenium voratum]|uniref:Major facilitator superfamily (MFS) profile domain-containing protein n=1 Tax=Effrenium voratum TaxID=2562239 RepID=A0AA36N1Y5_9DINO|nr:unnamed protein product [Effrenium voratum]